MGDPDPSMPVSAGGYGRAQPPAPSATAEKCEKQQKLTPEQLEKSLTRLYKLPNQQRISKRTGDQTEIEENAKRNQCRARSGEPTAKEAAIVTRLYTQPLEKREHVAKKLEQKHASPRRQPPKLSPDETESLVQRVFYQAADQKRNMQKQIDTKVYGKEPAAPHVLAPEQMKESVNKLYSQALEKKKEKIEKLEEEYAFIPKPTQQLDKAGVSALVERLHSGGK